MMRRFTMFILIIIIFSTNIITFANQDNQSIPQQDIEFEKLLMDEKSNQLIIKFGEGINLMSREDTLTKHSITSKDMSELAYKTKLVKVEDANLEDLIQDLEADPSIEYVEKNYIYKQSSRPNDTYYDNLWHLRNIDAEGAWDQVHQTGQEVVVAVIDSGIDDRHRDLVNRIVPGGYNFLCDNTSIYDFDGHGTFISGIISAEYNNNYGITGLAGNSNIKILPLRVTNHEGIANSGDIIRAIDYSISKNVDVINLSLGGPDYSNSLNDAIQRAINANIVVVAASGNDALIGNKISYPASYNGVISVGATDIHNNRSAFSNYNDFVDLVAPGEQLLSTSPVNNFELGSGTSYSTPMVSATAGLLRSIDPNLSVSEIVEILTTTAQDLGSKGKDPYYGYGLLNMNKAIKRVSKEPVTDYGDEYTDYKLMNVDPYKVFKVEFNYELAEDTLSGNIYTSLDDMGKIKATNFELRIDEENAKIVYVKPSNQWTKGYNYLFINDQVGDVDGRRHKNKLRITFYVD